jgi:hypothetical protein
VAQLLDQYVSTAGWDVSTRESNLGYIRRTINPALGSLQVVSGVVVVVKRRGDLEQHSRRMRIRRQRRTGCGRMPGARGTARRQAEQSA